MERLPLLDQEFSAVLSILATNENIPVTELFFARTAIGSTAVFYTDENWTAGTRFVCGVNSIYWQECTARVETNSLIARLVNPT